MAMQRVLVLEAQVPFVHGGAEILVRQLVGALRERGFEAEIVSIPFRDDPREQLMAHAAAWRLVDLTTSQGRPVDLVIGTKFPTYLVRHPAKVTWLVHQHRAAYELCGTPYSNFDHTVPDVGLRDRLVQIDTDALRECAGLFSIAKTVSARLQKYNGLTAEAVYHPPKLAKQLKAGPAGDYLLTVTRLEHVKRVDLAIEAFARVNPPTRLVIAGDGSARLDLDAQVKRLGLSNRVTLTGRITDEELIELYAGSMGLLFTPYDEDYGYVTLESFLSHKPVITAADSGGTLEFVVDGTNGFVAEPNAEALAESINRLAADRRRAAAMGDAGFELARGITWDGVVERLVGAASQRQPGPARG